MKHALTLASTAVLACAAGWFAFAGFRAASPARAVEPMTSIDEPGRLATRIGARLDEIGQIGDDLDDQETAVAKAEAALGIARHDAEVAALALREYDEGTYPQELALAEGELALAESDVRLLDESAPPPKPTDPSQAESKPPDAQARARAKLARDLARSHRDTLIRLTRPRKRAELQKEVDRATAEAKLKENALTQERADLKRLQGQREDAALTAEERQAMATSAESGKQDQAAALWRQAERNRADKVQATARERVRKALETPASP